MFRRRPFRRAPDGRLVVRLDDAEVDLLRTLATELRDLLASGDRSDPATARLFPRAYLDPTEERAETEWQALAGAHVLTDRLDRLAALVAGTDAVRDAEGTVELTLDPEGEAAWLGVLNDTRLALGSRLGVTDHDDLSDVPRDDPRAMAVAVYTWLSWLQGELIDVLLGEEPVEGSGE